MKSDNKRYQRTNADLRALEVLGLDETSSEGDADEAFRDLVKRWHPEQYRKDPPRYKEAESRFSEIQGAYQSLKRSRYFSRRGNASAKLEDMPIAVHIVDDD